MPHALRDGLKLGYEVKGEGEPILFIPGILSNRIVWGPVTRRITGVRAILIDNRDSGQSSLASSPYSIRDLAQDASAVLDHAGIPSAHIAGHSMGGAIAMEMALLEPARVSSLTLVNTWGKTDTYSGSVMRLMRLLRERLTDDAEFLHANTLIVNAAAPLQSMSMEDIAQSILLFDPLQKPEGYLRNLKAVLAHDILDRLPAIQCPTQVIWGDEDKVFPAWHARQLLQSIPHAKDLGLKGVGHMAILQAADAVAMAITSLVNAASSEPAPHRSR
jgi:pimeloyl-ACP methyl ester carboxylesterase